MNRRWMVAGALVGALVGVACGNGDDNSSGVTPPADAGAMSDGKSAADATSDATDASDAGEGAFALFVGTDFVNAELSAVALSPDTVAGHMPLDDQDSVPYASGGLGFVLEHTLGKTIVLDRAEPWTAKTTIDVNDSADAAPDSSNPRTVLVTTGTKAYVARYGSNVVKIVDVGAGTVTGSVDLSAFVAPDDPDGLVDVQDGAYDPASGRAYFLLQRINQFDFSGTAPDFVAACLVSRGEIVAVNVATDALVNLNGDAGSLAIDLLGDNPAAITPDFAHGRLLVTDAGCYQSADGGTDGGAALRLGRGIESVALLATPASTWLFQTSDIERLQGLIWLDATHAFVNEGTDWFTWNPTQPTLGSAVPNFPLAPVYDGIGRIVGLSATPPAAGSDAGAAWSVVALDVTTSNVTTIAANPFTSVVPTASIYGVSGVLLR